MSQTLTVPAVKTVQKGHTLYLFSVDVKQLHQFAAVSHLSRDDEGAVLGYQRPEVAAHIANIRRYVESDGAMLPNAVVLVFDSTVEFEPVNKRHPDLGVVAIPVPNGDGAPKPGFIVDGQQRSAAVKSFPLCVVAFLAKSEEEQREQFVLVNSARPLPKSLIYELLPGMSDGASLPPALFKRKLAAHLTQRLNSDEGSPFNGLVKMPSDPDGVVQDNTLMKMAEASLADRALSDFKGGVRRGEGPGPAQGVLANVPRRLGPAAPGEPAVPRGRGARPRPGHGLLRRATASTGCRPGRSSRRNWPCSPDWSGMRGSEGRLWRYRLQSAATCAAGRVRVLGRDCGMGCSPEADDEPHIREYRVGLDEFVRLGDEP